MTLALPHPGHSLRAVALWLTSLLALLLLPGPGAAQWDGDHLTCEGRNWNGDRERACEVREVRLGRLAEVDVDAGTNGGIHVSAWDGNEVLLAARVEAWADDREDAERLLDDVAIETSGTIRADGPRAMRRQSWSVSYHLRVPRETDLRLRTHNGGIRIEQVHGRIAFDATNGGIHLRGVGGDVRGETTNGGLHIDLDGNRWDGAGLDVKTTNGGVRLRIPDDYSASLETGTVNGGMRIDFPVMVQGRIGRSLRTEIGGGGPPIRAVTTNGGVTITRG